MSKQHEEFGQFIRDSREKLKITLRQLARDVEVSPTYLSQIEQGNFAPPSEEKIVLLAKHLKLDEDQLMAMANKIPSDLKPIFTEQPKPVADFLRTAQGLSNEDWEKLRKQAEKLQKD
jgi:transcriptional regulator with XRE-family HTH domain